MQQAPLEEHREIEWDSKKHSHSAILTSSRRQNTTNTAPTLSPPTSLAPLDVWLRSSMLQCSYSLQSKSLLKPQPQLLARRPSSVPIALLNPRVIHNMRRVAHVHCRRYQFNLCPNHIKAIVSNRVLNMCLGATKQSSQAALFFCGVSVFFFSTFWRGGGKYE